MRAEPALADARLAELRALPRPRKAPGFRSFDADLPRNMFVAAGMFVAAVLGTPYLARWEGNTHVDMTTLYGVFGGGAVLCFGLALYGRHRARVEQRLLVSGDLVLGHVETLTDMRSKNSFQTGFTRITASYTVGETRYVVSSARHIDDMAARHEAGDPVFIACDPADPESAVIYEA
jgi:hypothetical protein